MNKTFRQVLVPINFSSNPETVAERVVELLGQQRGAVHLICIVNPLKVAVNQPWLAISPANISDSDLFKKAEQWMDSCRNIFRDRLKQVLLSTEIVSGMSFQKVLVNSILKINPHIVILEDKTLRYSIEVAERTRQTLLVFVGNDHKKQVETLVVPLGNFVPQKKLLSIVSSFNKQNFKIYLVSVAKGDHATSPRNTTEAFRFIKSSVFCDVEHRILDGSNLLKATRNFCKTIHADAMLLDLFGEEENEHDQFSSEIRPYKNRPYLFNN